MPNEFDLLIVGAGPAGSFAAERLARAGIRVALFDGRPEGEPKACGGGVTAKALKAWPQLLGAVGRTVDELELYSPSGKGLHLQLEEPFAIYSRIAFDNYLRDLAARAGAEVIFEKVSARNISRTDSGWKLRDASGREWSGKFLVGADGANSGIAKKLAGPLAPSDMEVAFGYRAPLPESLTPRTVIAFLPNWDGYAWAFPRLDHISFGIATAQTTFDHRRLNELLWDFMVHYAQNDFGSKHTVWWQQKPDEPRIASIREHLRKNAEMYAGRIPKMTQQVWLTRRFSGPSWSLLGDAAGFADAITGEGIYYALRSAEIFSEAYLSEDIGSYENRCRLDFGDDLCRAAKLRNTFFGRFLGQVFTERMIQFCRYHFGVRGTLRDLVAGTQGYSDLKSVLIRRAFRPF